jgi:hypothetical protein
MVFVAQKSVRDIQSALGSGFHHIHEQLQVPAPSLTVLQ